MTLSVQDALTQTLACLLPTAKRCQCGLRVPHQCFTLNLDAPDAEDLDPQRRLLDEVDVMDLFLAARWNPLRTLLLTLCSQGAKVVMVVFHPWMLVRVKPGPRHLWHLVVFRFSSATFEALYPIAQNLKDNWGCFSRSLTWSASMRL